MRASRLRTIGCATAAAAALAAVPAGAQAAKAPAIDQAEFTATFSGSQVTTWETKDPRDPNDPCDHGSSSFGDQTIKFKVPGKFRLRVIKPDAEEPNLFGTNGRPSFATTPGIVYADATATRNGDSTFEHAPGGPGCEGDNGGGVDPNAGPPKDCGTRKGRFSPHFFYDTSVSEDDLVVPLGPQPPDKDWFKAGGRIFEWNSPGGTKKSTLDSTFENCEWTLASAWQEREGDLFIAREKFREKNFFNPRKKSFVISGSAIVDRNGPKTTGKTIIAWNLRLKRVK